MVWGGYVVLTVWALMIAKSRRPNALPLTLSAVGFYAFLSIIETTTGLDISALDFTATYGLLMVLSVLVGVLVSDGTYLWAGATALFVGGWSATVGLAEGDRVSTVTIRSVIAVISMVFAAVLLSRLLDLLARTISLYDRSSRLHNAVARCSEALLVENDDSAVHVAVSSLLEATEADYVYVDETVEGDDGPGWKILADAAKGAFDFEGWRTGSYASLPTLYEKLAAGEAVEVRTSELEGEERALYEDDEIKAEVCVPIMLDGEFKGSVGFIHYDAEREWDWHEIQTLWRAADMIGTYWRRQEDAAKLRASNEAKDSLLASVSHEIRTPLAAIVGLSEEIAAGGEGLTAAELKELNDIIATQGRELAELVEDLLVASRADSGDLSVQREPLDLVEQVERVLDGVRRSIPEGKQITFEGGHATAWGDSLRVRQVLRNLITNAIKYGGERILVSVDSSEGTARVRVADNGGGIPPEERDLIFERYYRGSRSGAQVGSMGIGLSLARRLAELMGGTVEYIPGEWHNFVLSLPAMDTAPSSVGDGVQQAVAAG